MINIVSWFLSEYIFFTLIISLMNLCKDHQSLKQHLSDAVRSDLSDAVRNDLSSTRYTQILTRFLPSSCIRSFVKFYTLILCSWFVSNSTWVRTWFLWNIIGTILPVMGMVLVLMVMVMMVSIFLVLDFLHIQNELSSLWPHQWSELSSPPRCFISFHSSWEKITNQSDSEVLEFKLRSFPKLARVLIRSKKIRWRI